MSEIAALRIETASQAEEDARAGGNTPIDSPLVMLAKSRLRLELQGLAFAISRGATPEEYARFLWGRGAQQWMGTASPDADQYLLKEAEAMSRVFPWVKVQQVKMSATDAEIIMAEGCLGGWGENRFQLARNLGLNRIAVCRYCGEACKAWGEQLGLIVESRSGPGCRGGCRMTAYLKPDCTALAQSPSVLVEQKPHMAN